MITDFFFHLYQYYIYIYIYIYNTKEAAEKAMADKEAAEKAKKVAEAAAENSKKAAKANYEGDLLNLEEIPQFKPYRIKQPVRYSDGCDKLFLYLIIINFDYLIYLSIQSHTRIKKLLLKLKGKKKSRL